MASSSNQQPRFLNQSELENLSKDPRNRIYQYEYDTPTVSFTATQQKLAVAEIRAEYVQLCKSNNDDDKIRAELKQNPKWNKFAENHDKTFELITNRNTPHDHLLHVNYMLYLREQQDIGNIDSTNANMMIQDYLVSKFKTEKTLDQYKQELKEEKENEDRDKK